MNKDIKNKKYQEAALSEAAEWAKVTKARMRKSSDRVIPEMDYDKAPPGLYDVPWATGVYWRKYYHDPADNFFEVSNWQRSFNNIANQLEISDDALDLGCGLGVAAVGLARMGFRVKAFDLSEEPIRIAKAYANKENLQIDYFIGDANAIDTYKNLGKFSAIVIRATFHHIAEPDFLLSNLRDNHLLPGGKIYIFESGPPKILAISILQQILSNVRLGFCMC